MLLPYKFPLISHLVGTSRITDFSISLGEPWGCLTNIPGVKFRLEVGGLCTGCLPRWAPQSQGSSCLGHLCIVTALGAAWHKGILCIRPFICFHSYIVLISGICFLVEVCRSHPRPFCSLYSLTPTWRMGILPAMQTPPSLQTPLSQRACCKYGRSCDTRPCPGESCSSLELPEAIKELSWEHGEKNYKWRLHDIFTWLN